MESMENEIMNQQIGLVRRELIRGETFLELHGDRTVKDDKAMVGGFGKIGDQAHFVS